MGVVELAESVAVDGFLSLEEKLFIFRALSKNNKKEREKRFLGLRASATRSSSWESVENEPEDENERRTYQARGGSEDVGNHPDYARKASPKQ